MLRATLDARKYMEPTQAQPQQQPISTSTTAYTVTTPPSEICSVCHIPLLPSYYFCPNCGKQIHEPPLPTDFGTQLGLYLFSIILPLIAFLFVTRWKGFKYMRQSDLKAKIIGMIATVLLIGTTVFSFWYAYHVTTMMVQKAMTEAGPSLEILQNIH
jgi:hypothetical protein